MIKAAINKMRYDPVLTGLLKPTAKDTRIYPLSTNNFGPCIVYTNTPQAGGRIRQNTLELRIVGKDYETVQAIEKRLNELFDFVEGADVGWIDGGVNIMSSILIGGGELELGDVIERFVTYSIKWRYI